MFLKYNNFLFIYFIVYEYYIYNMMYMFIYNNYYYILLYIIMLIYYISLRGIMSISIHIFGLVSKSIIFANTNVIIFHCTM